MAATVSKDVLALSKIGMDGCSLMEAQWQQTDPADSIDVNVLKHGDANKLWTGDNDGRVRYWDVNASGRGIVADFHSGATGWLSGMEIWEQASMMCCSHSSGLCFVDVRTTKVVQDMKKKEAVGALTALNTNSNLFFAGVGGDLMQYDTRKFASDLDYKNMAVGMWNLKSPITAMSCTETGRGHLLVAAGCMDGKVVVLDST